MCRVTNHPRFHRARAHLAVCPTRDASPGAHLQMPLHVAHHDRISAPIVAVYGAQDAFRFLVARLEFLQHALPAPKVAHEMPVRALFLGMVVNVGPAHLLSASLRAHHQTRGAVVREVVFRLPQWQLHTAPAGAIDIAQLARVVFVVFAIAISHHDVALQSALHQPMRTCVGLVAGLFRQPHFLDAASEITLDDPLAAIFHEMILHRVARQLRAAPTAAVHQLCRALVLDVPLEVVKVDVLVAIALHVAQLALVLLVVVQCGLRARVAASVGAGTQQQLAAIAFVRLELFILHELTASVAAKHLAARAFKRVVIATLRVEEHPAGPVALIDEMVPQFVQLGEEFLPCFGDEFKSQVLCAHTNAPRDKRKRRRVGGRGDFFRDPVRTFLIPEEGEIVLFAVRGARQMSFFLVRKQLPQLGRSRSSRSQVGRQSFDGVEYLQTFVYVIVEAVQRPFRARRVLSANPLHALVS